MKKSMTYYTLLKLSILAVAAGGLLWWPMVGTRWINNASAQESSDNNRGGMEFLAVNPGYTVDGVGNTGEVIVLRRTGNEVLLTGFKIRYTNSNGNSSLLLEFPEGAVMTGETVQLRLVSDASGADLNYTKTVAMSGKLELLSGAEVVDTVCFNGEEGCAMKFDSKKPTMLKREGREWQHVEVFEVLYEGPGIRWPEAAPNEDLDVVSKCASLEFSELLSYYETDKREQFIEFYNGGAEQITVEGCAVRYKGKNYGISGVVASAGYLVVYPESLGFALTKNPGSANTVELVDTTGAVVDSLTYYSGQRKGVAVAQFGYSGGVEQWLATFQPTPGYENDYQKFKSCEAGKVINEETGNCVKDSTLDTTLEACPEGKYRNPLTGRCKSYASDDEGPAPCAEGYERNPETGRCRKIRTNTGADYGLVAEEGSGETNFIAVGAIGAVVAVGMGYVVWQFKGEIGRGVMKVVRKFMKKNGR